MCLLFVGRLRCITRLFEEEDVFRIKFDNAITRVWKAAHYGTAAGGVHCRGLLPNDLSHEIEADGFAKTDDLGVDRDHFIAPIIDGSGKLITDVDKESTTVVENAMAFAPHEVEMVDISLVTVVETDLIGGAIVFQLPISGRSDDQMDALVLHFTHAAAVALDDCVVGMHN